MEKRKLRYKGAYPIVLHCHGFQGIVKPSDEIEVLQSAFDELRSHEEWEIVVERKQKIEKEGAE